LIGGVGADSLEGGDGDDVLAGGEGSDIVDGGVGRDTADYSAATAFVRVKLSDASANLGEALGDTYSSIENVIGSAHDDRIFGDDFDNRIDGRAGNDNLYGGPGHGNDELFGGTGDDGLFGGGGDDVLVGGEGADTLTSGVGADVFLYLNGAHSTAQTQDLISDFDESEDRIDLQALALQFGELTIATTDGNTIISHNHSDFSIRLSGESYTFGADQFIF